MRYLYFENVFFFFLKHNPLTCRCILSPEAKRTHPFQISEAEEKLKQKVESLSQYETEYKTLQDDLKNLTDKYGERGNLLHIANDRVNQVLFPSLAVWLYCTFIYIYIYIFMNGNTEQARCALSRACIP